jgi:mRNA-degrading endonuclease RelE of RelBE toxin-antitoxin system
MAGSGPAMTTRGCRTRCVSGGAAVDFRIADTFTDSLTRLTAQEQKAVKTAAFDLQMDPSAPGLSFHKLDRAKDKSFWSIRVNADIRLIVHRTATSLLLAYVGHHDAAYKWAEQRKIERHPTTGAMQLVEVRERVEDVGIFKPSPFVLPLPNVPPLPLPNPPPQAGEGRVGAVAGKGRARAETSIAASAVPLPKPKLFDNLRKFELMAFGVPEEWVDDVRAATENTLFDIIGHLPQEAQEALLKLAVGERPEPPKPAPATVDPFSHPDAQRRFRVLANVEELQRALDFPWEKWAVFLHPAQRQLVERAYGGPARVSGSAGTGKTIVAIHRAAFLARRHPAARILLTTFSKALANALKAKIDHLVGNETALAGRIVVRPLTGIGYDMYAEAFGTPNIVSAAIIRALLEQVAKAAGTHRFSPQFLLGEWSDVVDAWQLASWEAYRDVARLGRKTRIGGKQREILWSIFAGVRAGLDERKLVTWPQLFGRLCGRLASGGSLPYDYVVVDEAQDVGIAELRYLAALGGGRPDALFFAGDLGQRIFQQPFSWKALGVDIRGRSYALRINYRTSHQIRSHADRLLPASVCDVDGNAESRRGTVSVFNGPAPAVEIFAGTGEEGAAVGRWIAARLKEGLQPHEIGVFVRSERELKRARAAVKAAASPFTLLSDKVETQPGHVAIGTMHLAKGLEFRAVAVMACDDEIIPLQERIESVADDSDLEEVYDTERHLLYVACTRARDHLLVTGVEPASEFLDDFGSPERAK